MTRYTHVGNIDAYILCVYGVLLECDQEIGLRDLGWVGGYMYIDLVKGKFLYGWMDGCVRKRVTYEYVHM